MSSAPPCLWCGGPTDRESFRVGNNVFCSGKHARYFADAPISSSSTFFEDARRRFDPPLPVEPIALRKTAHGFCCEHGVCSYIVGRDPIEHSDICRALQEREAARG